MLTKTVLLLLATTTSTAHSAEKHALRPSVHPGQVSRITVKLEVSGKLKMNADGKDVSETPLNVTGELAYLEQVVQTTELGHMRRTARQYERANAQIKIRDWVMQPKLNAERRLIVADLPPHQSPLLFSPQGPLTHEDLDVINLQFNSGLLEYLLPVDPQEVGQTWKIESPALPALLGIDALSVSTVEATLKSYAELATIQLKGKVSGAVHGVSTELEVDGTLSYDPQRGRIVSLNLTMKEERAIGHAEPGLNVVAQVQVSVEDTDDKMSAEQLSTLKDPPSEASSLLQFVSQSNKFRFLHGRDWKLMVDRPDVTIFRLIQKGDFVAQANFSKLPENGTPVTPASFQREIQAALGEKFGQVSDVDQQERPDGTRVLRVMVVGQVETIPIQWIYYHLQHPEGQALSAIFTLDAQLAERFGAADHPLMESLQF